MGFWGKRWEDVRGNLVYQILAWIFTGGLIAAIFKGVGVYRTHPYDWKVVGLIFLISALGLAVVTLLASRTKSQQPQTMQAEALIPSSQIDAVPNFDAVHYFRTQYQSSLTAEAERNIRMVAAQSQPNDREGFMAKVLGIGIVSSMHDSAWAYMYKSQVLTLVELNRRGGMMAAAIARPYYDQASTDCPNVYKNYSFNQWMEWLVRQQLVIFHPSDMVEITVRGRDFLTYLAHGGHTPEERRC